MEKALKSTHTSASSSSTRGASAWRTRTGRSRAATTATCSRAAGSPTATFVRAALRLDGLRREAPRTVGRELGRAAAPRRDGGRRMRHRRWGDALHLPRAAEAADAAPGRHPGRAASPSPCTSTSRRTDSRCWTRPSPGRAPSPGETAARAPTEAPPPRQAPEAVRPEAAEAAGGARRPHLFQLRLREGGDEQDAPRPRGSQDALQRVRDVLGHAGDAAPEGPVRGRLRARGTAGADPSGERARRVQGPTHRSQGFGFC